MATKTLTLYPYNYRDNESRFANCLYDSSSYSTGAKITYSTGSTSKYLGDLCSNDYYFSSRCIIRSFRILGYAGVSKTSKITGSSGQSEFSPMFFGSTVSLSIPCPFDYPDVTAQILSLDDYTCSDVNVAGSIIGGANADEPTYTSLDYTWSGLNTRCLGPTRGQAFGVSITGKPTNLLSGTGTNFHYKSISFELTLEYGSYITFETNSDECVDETQEWEGGKNPVYSHTLKKTGYDFVGWRSSRNNQLYTSTLPVADEYDTTYTAEWKLKVLKIDLTHNTPINSVGTTTIYLKYSDGWYSDAEATNKITILPELPTRIGYNFNCYFQDFITDPIIYSDGTFNQEKLTFTTQNISLISFWDPISYLIHFNPNKGEGSSFSQWIKYDLSTVIPENKNNFTKIGYNFSHWNTKADNSGNSYYPGEEKILNLTQVDEDEINFYAIWTPQILISYDTIFNYFDWYRKEISGQSNCSVSNITNIGFTVTSNSGVSEGTVESPVFSVEAGKKYKIDIDIIGDNWDVYIFFRNSSGTWLGTDTNSRFSSNGFNSSRVFEAPAGTVQAAIRVDANGTNNTVRFENFRIYPAEYYYMGYTVSETERSDCGQWSAPANPTRNNNFYKFKHWSKEPGLEGKNSPVTTSGEFPTEDTVLFSQWDKRAPRIFIQEADKENGQAAPIVQLHNQPIRKAFIYTTDSNKWKEC